MTTISVDVVSDVVCPWCYIGRRRLEKAITELKGRVAVDVRWRPFQLDPTIPAGGSDRKAYMEMKFGGPDGAARANEPVRQAGAEEGIPFDFDAIKVSPNTLDAHRVIRWASAAGLGVQDRLVGILFRMYFTQGRNIGDAAVLLEAAREAGMDAAVVEPLLKGGADRAEVRHEIETAQKMGVTGVPCFILDGRYAIMGAQPVTALVRTIDGLATQKEKDAASAG